MAGLTCWEMRDYAIRYGEFGDSSQTHEGVFEVAQNTALMIARDVVDRVTPEVLLMAHARGLINTDELREYRLLLKERRLSGMGEESRRNLFEELVNEVNPTLAAPQKNTQQKAA